MIFGHFIGFSHILSWDRSLYIPVYIIITHCTSDTENQSFQTTYGKIIARSALSVGLRFKSRCLLSVVWCDRFWLDSAWATAAGSRYCLLVFWRKDPFFAVFDLKRTSLKSCYGAGGLDWGSQKLFIFAKNGPVWNRVTGREVWIGGPKNCSFSPKTDQFEIVLRGGRSGLGVPKTVHFRQKQTSLKSCYGAGGLDWGSQKLLIFAKNRPVWNRVTGREVWIGGPKNCFISRICPHQAIRAPALQSVI